MSDRIRKAIGLACLAAALLLMTSGGLLLNQPDRPAVVCAAAGRIQAPLKPIPVMDGEAFVNRAGAEELTELPGIGGTIAEAIITEREANGLYCYPEDLISVKGIGKKKQEQIFEEK